MRVAILTAHSVSSISASSSRSTDERGAELTGGNAEAADMRGSGSMLPLSVQRCRSVGRPCGQFYKSKSGCIRASSSRLLTQGASIVPIFRIIRTILCRSNASPNITDRRQARDANRRRVFCCKRQPNCKQIQQARRHTGRYMMPGNSASTLIISSRSASSY